MKGSPIQHLHQMLVSKELGGAGVIALHVASFLRDRVKGCHVWIPGEGPAENKARELGLTNHRYDAASLLRPSKIKNALGNWRTGQALRAYRPGIIHIHSPFSYRVLYPGIKFSRLKCVVHVHLEEEQAGLRWAFQQPPDLIVTCARFLVEHVRAALPERYQNNFSIMSVPNAVDTEQFQPGDKKAACQRVGARYGIPLILMAANLAPHKGQETAIRAAARLKEEGVNVLFWLAGVEREGKQDYTAHLRSLCCELGVADRVRLLGQRADISDLLRATDVFLLPSTVEGLPLSVLEAQATKVPVLAAPTAGIPEVVIDGETGFLISSADAAGYANRIKLLLSDRNMYTRVVDQAYAKVVNEYNWKVYTERLWDVYQYVI